MWFTTIRDYYLRGFYNEEQLQVFLQANWITQAEYDEIIASKPTP